MAELPLWVNLALFVVAAAVIWRAGTHLERRADQISKRTGLGQAFVGVLLLATATSLPEVATTVSAIAIHHNASLAVHNLLGGVALQTALLVIADAVSRRRGALTSFRPRSAMLIQGIGVLMLLHLVIAGWTTGGAPAFAAISLWSVLLLVGFVAMMYLTYRERWHPRWTPTPADDYPADAAEDADGEPTDTSQPLRAIGLRFAGAAALVLVAGWLASGAADALADQTGLGSAFFGATALALATSLPELSTTISASRAGRYTTAMSNVFGSNAFDVALLFVADALFRDGAVIAGLEGSGAFVAVIGAIMTCVYLWGLMERADRTILGIGWDSMIAAVVYAAGMAVLYFAW